MQHSRHSLPDLLGGAYHLAQRMLVFGGLVAILTIIVSVTLGGLTFNKGVSLASLMVVAVLPFTFPWLYMRFFPRPGFVGQFSTIALTAGIVQLYLVAFGLVSSVFLHIPAALNGMLLLAIDLFVLVLPRALLVRGRPLRTAVTPARLLRPREVVRASGHGLAIGVLALANYLWFFERYGLEARFLAGGSVIHSQAATLAFATVVLCLLIELLARFGSGQFFKRHHFQNPSLWLLATATAALGAAVLYGPWPWLFGAQPLNGGDWLYVLSAALIYGLIRDFHYFQKSHSRKAVLELHKNGSRSRQT